MNPTHVAGAGASANIDIVQARPWYREPWVWVLIAFPLASVVGCAITIWLALSHPDYLVVDEQEYQQIEAGLDAAQGPASQVPAGTNPSAEANLEAEPNPSSAPAGGREPAPDDGRG